MTYYQLKPEVAGNSFGPRSIVDVSAHPPKVSRLDYEFDGWLGDDLLESFPCFIVTMRLKDALTAINPTGCEFDHADVSKSEDFEERHPDRELPKFVWLKITGRAGEDDFGMSTNHKLIVSERVLRALQEFQTENCEVEEYAASPVAA